MTKTALYKFTPIALISLAVALLAGGSLTSCSSGGGGGSSCSGNAATVASSENSETPLTTAYRLPLGGCTSIDYTVSGTVGATAGMNLIIDSGSTTLGVAAASCSNCTSISPTYSASSSEANTCVAASSTYADGSGFSGLVVNDSVQLGSIPAVSVSLASITSQTDDFFSDYDCSLGTSGTNSSQGILGLAGSAIALPSTTGYLDALNAQQSFPGIFATQLCMTGGNIWFGNYDSSFFNSPSTAPLYTPISQAGTYFYVGLSNLLVGGTSLGLTTGSFPAGSIVDTGTSIGVFGTSVFNGIAAQIATSASFRTFVGASNATDAANWFSNGNCVLSTMSEASIDSSLPTLSMVFPSTTSGTIQVDLPASRSYLDLHQVGGQNYFCPGIMPDDGSGDPTIIGASLLRSQITIFDRNSNRIGFAPQTGCSL